MIAICNTSRSRLSGEGRESQGEVLADEDDEPPILIVIRCVLILLCVYCKLYCTTAHWLLDDPNTVV